MQSTISRGRTSLQRNVCVQRDWPDKKQSATATTREDEGVTQSKKKSATAPPGGAATTREDEGVTQSKKQSATAPPGRGEDLAQGKKRTEH